MKTVSSVDIKLFNPLCWKRTGSWDTRNCDKNGNIEGKL